MMIQAYKKTVKTVVLLLLITVMGPSLCSCDSQASINVSSGTVIGETEDNITIVDQAGRKVTAPTDIESIALCYRVVVRFLLSLDQGEKIKGIGKTEEFLFELEPSLKDCVEVGKGVVDIEALAKLKPDIFFHKSGDTKTLEAVEKLGIPAVGISVETPEDMKKAIYIIGKLCGNEKKAELLIEYYNGKLNEFKKLRSLIGTSEKKTAVMMGSSIGSVADGSMLQSQMIENAGGISLAKETEATELWPVVGVEQIFKWNPDYIFITNSESAAYSQYDLLNDPDWQEIKAVKNKHVYTMPAKNDSWEFPGITSVLGMEYMMKEMYPDLITDKKLGTDVDELYKLSYGKTIDRDKLGY